MQSCVSSRNRTWCSSAKRENTDITVSRLVSSTLELRNLILTSRDIVELRMIRRAMIRLITEYRHVRGVRARSARILITSLKYYVISPYHSRITHTLKRNVNGVFPNYGDKKRQWRVSKSHGRLSLTNIVECYITKYSELALRARTQYREIIFCLRLCSRSPWERSIRDENITFIVHSLITLITRSWTICSRARRTHAHGLHS